MTALAFNLFVPLSRLIEIPGGGWDVVHAGNNIRHGICFECGGPLTGKHRMSNVYGWLICGTDTGETRRRSAYICDGCYMRP